MDEYRKKLIEWNSRDKYIKEINFLGSIMRIDSSDYILDYGCGTMTAVKHFKNNFQCEVNGYDVIQYADPEDFIFYDNSLKKKYSKIYLNHVIAHLRNAEEVVNSLKKNLISGGHIYIITPNKLWLNYMSNEKYNPDATVINHYSLTELELLFKRNGFRVLSSGQFGEFLGQQRERLFLEAVL